MDVVHVCYRTARGDSSGTALSFVTVKEMPLLEAVKQMLSQGSCKYLLVTNLIQYNTEKNKGSLYAH